MHACVHVQAGVLLVGPHVPAGLSRTLSVDRTHLSTCTWGTITHMCPSLLLHGKMRPSCDVYSYGIIRKPFGSHACATSFKLGFACGPGTQHARPGPSTQQ